MALGIVITPVPIKNAGGYKVKIVEFTYDATYAVGGYAITPAALGFDQAISFISPGATSGAGDTGFLINWDKAAAKIEVLKAGTADAPLNEADTNQASLTGLKSYHVALGF